MTAPERFPGVSRDELIGIARDLAGRLALAEADRDELLRRLHAPSTHDQRCREAEGDDWDQRCGHLVDRTAPPRMVADVPAALGAASTGRSPVAWLWRRLVRGL